VSNRICYRICYRLKREGRGYDGSHSRASRAGTRYAWIQAGKLAAAIGRSRNRFIVSSQQTVSAYSIGTRISLSRTMLSRVLAADSIARGLSRNCSTSMRSRLFPSRNVCTSVCILTYCSDAAFILVRVRTVTVAQTASVASIIMPKITHEGMIPPRRRISAREPSSSTERSRTGANGDTARDATRCERIRSSTQ